MDFTINKYKELLKALQNQGFAFQTFSDFIKTPVLKSIVLRHDVDLLPYNSLRFAEIQHEFGVKGTYYFRAVPESWDENVIIEIARMGHEVGYHYESLTTCKGNTDQAYNDFCINLDRLRKLGEVKTICMHGSPASPYDSKEIWNKYDYKSLGIIAEPYFDVDFSNVFYLTDTGRRFDGYKVSVRDKIPVHQERWNCEGLVFHTTNDIIKGADKLPNKIMFTFHPQRWHNKMLSWIMEYFLQNSKNQIKRVIINLKN